MLHNFENTSLHAQYLNFVSSYLTYRQERQAAHSKVLLKDFMILKMSLLQMTPIRLNSSTFAGKLDLLDHIVSYTDRSPDVLAYKLKMHTENKCMWPKETSKPH